MLENAALRLCAEILTFVHQHDAESHLPLWMNSVGIDLLPLDLRDLDAVHLCLSREWLSGSESSFCLTALGLERVREYAIELRLCGQPLAPVSGFEESAPPKLRERELLCLEAMIELGAVSKMTRRCTLDVAQRAFGPDSDENNAKKPIADLVGRDYVGSLKGRSGGVWITPLGSAVVSAKKVTTIRT